MDVEGVQGPNKGKNFLCIYELDGDTMRNCYELSGKSRPTEFKTTEGTQLFLVTYMREKPRRRAGQGTPKMFVRRPGREPGALTEHTAKRTIGNQYGPSASGVP